MTSPTNDEMAGKNVLCTLFIINSEEEEVVEEEETALPLQEEEVVEEEETALPTQEEEMGMATQDMNSEEEETAEGTLTDEEEDAVM